MEGLNKSVIKNKDGYYERGTMSKEEFELFVGKCFDIIKKHIDAGGGLSPKGIAYLDDQGNKYMGEMVPFSSYSPDTPGLITNDYEVYLKEGSVEEGKEIIASFTERDHLPKSEDPKRPYSYVEEINKTPEELEELFKDIKGYFEKK